MVQCWTLFWYNFGKKFWVFIFLQIYFKFNALLRFFWFFTLLPNVNREYAHSVARQIVGGIKFCIQWYMNYRRWFSTRNLMRIWMHTIFNTIEDIFKLARNIICVFVTSSNKHIFITECLSERSAERLNVQTFTIARNFGNSQNQFKTYIQRYRIMM